MTEFGLDYVAGPSIAVLKAAQVAFVCRYVGYFGGYSIERIDVPQGKVLTPREAKALSDAGISLVSNYEWYAARALEGHASGVWDATTAMKIHLACGGYAERPIYFSVDVDAQGSQVADYFRGVAMALGLSRTGCYGSYRVLKYLFDNHLIAWGWQTYAWSYGQWEPRAHLRQVQNGVNLGGHWVDHNTAMAADFGQWKVGEEPMVAISIHTPGVSAEFDELDAQHWRSKKSGKIIAHGILEAYKKYGNSGLCGLTYLGHPDSNEIPKGTNKVIQFYQFGVLCWDNGRVYPLDLYADGSLGTDPRIAPLQKQAADLQAHVQSQAAQITQLESQPQPEPTNVIPADIQAKLDHDEALLSQFRQLLAS